MTKEFDLQVPQMTGETLIVPIATGEILFVLGANGVGKSSLVTRLHRDHIGSSKRIGKAAIISSVTLWSALLGGS